MNLSRKEFKIDLVKGNNPRKTFDNPLHYYLRNMSG
jgi:hypothetical protein